MEEVLKAASVLVSSCEAYGAGKLELVGNNEDGTTTSGVFVSREHELTVRLQKVCAEWDAETEALTTTALPGDTEADAEAKGGE